MVTKKWVEATIRRLIDERIDEHNKDDSETIEQMKKELGWEHILFSYRGGLSSPHISVNEKIAALYKHFVLAPCRTDEKSSVIAKKIKKGK